MSLISFDRSIQRRENNEITSRNCSILKTKGRGKVQLFCVVLLNVSLTVKAATLIFISGCGSAISSAKEGKSAFNIIC